MYLEFFHCARPPFSNTSDPTFYYASAAHREALATLVYGIRERKGLCLLTGPVGSGKTLLLRKLTTDHPDYAFAWLNNPWIQPNELFAFLGHAFALSSLPEVDALANLHQQLVAATQQQSDKRFVFVIDEAHLLPETALETVRLLLNLEDERGKLLQTILSGQDELLETLRQPHMRPLLQRVALVEHLRPFDLDDTIGYIQHRLRTAGADPYLFPRHCIELIHSVSRGIPRLINQICDHALTFAYGRQSRSVERQDVEAAISKLPLGEAFLSAGPEKRESAAPEIFTSLSATRPTPSPTASDATSGATAAGTSSAAGVAASVRPEPPAAPPLGAGSAPDAVPPEVPPLSVGLNPAAMSQPSTMSPAVSAEVPPLAAGASANTTSRLSPSAPKPDVAAIATAAEAGQAMSVAPHLQPSGVPWTAYALAVVAALALGAGSAYWWLSRTPDKIAAVATPEPAARSTSEATLNRDVPTRPAHPQESMAPASLPLPIATQTVEMEVKDTKELLTLISRHFGADNATARDLLLATNPSLTVEAITTPLRIRLPRLQRSDMIVPDARGRFYIYYATVTDDQQIAQIRQTLQPLGVEVVSLPTVLGGRWASRVYLGPYLSFDAARRILDVIRFSYLPALELGTLGASTS